MEFLILKINSWLRYQISVGRYRFFRLDSRLILVIEFIFIEWHKKMSFVTVCHKYLEKFIPAYNAYLTYKRLLSRCMQAVVCLACLLACMISAGSNGMKTLSSRNCAACATPEHRNERYYYFVFTTQLHLYWLSINMSTGKIPMLKQNSYCHVVRSFSHVHVCVCVGGRLRGRERGVNA